MEKRALITGATSGIGRATALRLAALGYDIVATGRRTERLAALRAQIEAAGGRCTILAFDVRSEEEVRRLLGPLDGIDLLVNNAGLAAGLEHIDAGDTADWDAMIDTNVKGLLYVTRTIAPKMVAAVRSPARSPTRTARSTAPRNTPCTPSRRRCAPTCWPRASA